MEWRSPDSILNVLAQHYTENTAQKGYREVIGGELKGKYKNAILALMPSLVSIVSVSNCPTP